MEYLYISWEYADNDYKNIDTFLSKALVLFDDFEIYSLYNESLKGNIKSQEKLESYLDSEDEFLLIIVYKLLFKLFHMRRDAHSILKISTTLTPKIKNNYNKIIVNFGLSKYFSLTSDFTKSENLLNEIISYIIKNNFEKSMNHFLISSLCDIIHANQIIGDKNIQFFKDKFEYIQHNLIYDEYSQVSHYLGILFDFNITNYNFTEAERILFALIWSTKNYSISLYNRIAFEFFSENKIKLKNLLDTEIKKAILDNNLKMIFSMSFLLLDDIEKSDYYVSLVNFDKNKSYELMYLTTKSLIEYKKNNNEESQKIMLKALQMSKDFSLVGNFLATAKSILALKYFVISDIYDSLKSKEQKFDVSFIEFIKNILDRINEIIEINKSNTKLVNNPILTKRENEILVLMDQGLTNKQISESLFISMPTLKTHISHIFKKIGVTNRKNALIFYKLENISKEIRE
jgi:DNA-binding CsgD family transcriptional regulator